MQRKKRTTSILYDPRVRALLPRGPRLEGGKFKYLPEHCATGGGTDVFGDHVVMFTGVEIGNFGQNGMIFVIIHPELAETYRTWFRLIWDACPPVRSSRNTKNARE